MGNGRDNNLAIGFRTFPFVWFWLICLSCFGGSLSVSAIEPAVECKRVLAEISERLKELTGDEARHLVVAEDGTKAVFDLLHQSEDLGHKYLVVRAFEMELSDEAIQLGVAKKMEPIQNENHKSWGELSAFNTALSELHKAVEMLPLILQEGKKKVFTHRDSPRFAGKEIQQVADELKQDVEKLYRQGQAIAKRMNESDAAIEAQISLLQDQSKVYEEIGFDFSQIAQHLPENSDAREQMHNLSVVFSMASALSSKATSYPESLQKDSSQTHKLFQRNVRLLGIELPNKLRAIQMGTLMKTIADTTGKMAQSASLLVSGGVSQEDIDEVRNRIAQVRDREKAAREQRLAEIRESLKNRKPSGSAPSKVTDEQK